MQLCFAYPQRQRSGDQTSLEALAMPRSGDPDGAGLAADAAARMDFAAKFQSDDAETVRMNAIAKASAGDFDGALALDALGGQQSTVWRSCLQIRAGRNEEGLVTLKIVVPQMTLPHLLHANMVDEPAWRKGI